MRRIRQFILGCAVLAVLALAPATFAHLGSFTLDSTATFQQVSCEGNVDHLLAGQTFLDNADYERAIEAFTCAIENDTHNFEAYWGRSSAHRLLEDDVPSWLDMILMNTQDRGRAILVWQDAVAHYTRQIEANPDDFVAYLLRGWANIWLGPDGDRTLLLADADRILALDPDNAFAYTLKGDWERAIELAPNNHALHAAFAEQLLIHHTGNALEHINRAIELDPEEGFYYQFRGITYHLLGNRALEGADFAHHIELTRPEIVVQNVSLGEPTTLPLTQGQVYSIPVQAVAGQRLSVSATTRNSERPFDLTLVLLAEDGTPLTGNRNPEDGSYRATLSPYIVRADGTYTVLVTNQWPFVEGEFTVTVSLRG